MQTQKKNGEVIRRALIYIMGVFFLSVGITLNTKTGLGVSTITSVPFSIANAFGLGFSVSVFVVYTGFVVLEFLLKGKNRQWLDALQIPFSMVFSVLLGWLGSLLALEPQSFGARLVILALGVVFTGFGMVLMMNMHVVPNPADGLVQAISGVIRKDDGMSKNILDAICVAVTLCVDLIFTGRVTSVGLGTVVGMIFVGRIVSLFNHLFRTKLLQLSGLTQTV